MEHENFRFSSKEEYESEISKVLLDLNSVRSSRKISAKSLKKIESRYEELVEEYVNFLDSDDK